MNGLLPPWGEVLSQTDGFCNADVVHYHLIHNQMISLLDLPRLFAEKPSVWTFHDSWPLTGHCIQPCGCDEWSTGCTLCSRPELPFPLAPQYSKLMWNVKRDVYSRLDVDIVVASKRLAERIERSELGRLFGNVHMIPFSAGALDIPPRPQARTRIAKASANPVALSLTGLRTCALRHRALSSARVRPSPGRDRGKEPHNAGDSVSLLPPVVR